MMTSKKQTYKKSIVILSVLTFTVKLIISLVGLLSNQGPGTFQFTSIFEQTIEIYGKGIYQYESAFKSPILRGTDLFFVILGIPALVYSTWRYKKTGTIKSKLMHLGVLTCFLYNSASVAFATQYNNFYLLYLLNFSTTLFVFINMFMEVADSDLNEHISKSFPHKKIGLFVIIAGFSTLVWAVDHIFALLENEVPKLISHYTTDVTGLIDIGIILPCSIIGGIMLRKKEKNGYILSSMMLILLVFIGLVVLGQSAIQILDGVQLSGMEFALFVIPFVSLATLAVYYTKLFFKNIS